MTHGTNGPIRANFAIVWHVLCFSNDNTPNSAHG